MTVAMALAEFSHHSAPRSQKTARAGGELGGMYGTDVAHGIQGIFAQAAARREMPREPEDDEARSSDKMGKKGKKGKRRKKRKKKLPKGSSSSPRRGGSDQGTKTVHAEDALMEVAGCSGQRGIAVSMDGMGIKENVIRGKEFIRKHGQPVETIYGDRLHLYTQSSESYWLDWMKERW